MRKLLLLVIVSAALVSSCSFLRLALRYAEWMIVRDTVKTFDLDDGQSAKLKTAVKSEIKWIKKEWLPGLITTAQELEQRWTDGLSLDDHLWFEKDWIKRREVLARHGLPKLAPIAVTISVEQLGHAAIAFGKRNEKRGDLLKLDDSALEKKRKVQLEDTMEEWYGKLSDVQILQLCEIFGCGRSDVERIVNSAQLFQGRFLDLLRDERDETRWTATLIEWTNHPALMLPLPKRASWLEFRNGQAQRLARLDRIMTQKQRDHAKEKLHDLVEDLKWFASNDVKD